MDTGEQVSPTGMAMLDLPQGLNGFVYNREIHKSYSRLFMFFVCFDYFDK